MRAPLASELRRRDPCRVRPGSSYAGHHGVVYTVLPDGSAKPVCVLLERTEDFEYYAVDELEFPFTVPDDGEENGS